MTYLLQDLFKKLREDKLSKLIKKCGSQFGYLRRKPDGDWFAVGGDLKTTSGFHRTPEAAVAKLIAILKSK